MFKPNNYIKSLKHQESEYKSTFTVLSWNVAKLTLKSSYIEYLKLIVKDYKIDMLLLQEVKKQLARELDVFDFSYILSPNIETKKHVFGVMNAFNMSCENNMSLLTKKRELKYMTHKVSLITKHKISNSQTLLMVNIHAINFVKNSNFHQELNYLKEAIKSHFGPMIVAGDFNTWNVKRVNMLKEFVQDLSLEEVKFNDSSNIKKVFKNSLDYMFYRGIELTRSMVINSKKISDHNPIIATFNLMTK